MKEIDSRCSRFKKRFPFSGLLTNLRVSMPFNVHLRKRTNISNTNNVDSEISEEIHDIQRLVAQIKTQKKRCHNRAK